MRILVKDENDKVMILESIDGIIPSGLTAVPSEDLETSELIVARETKLSEIRSKRDLMLAKNDTLWLIASKKGEPTTSLEADAETLRDLPELAETELNALETVEEIQAYDCFSGLALTGDYE